MCALSRAIVWQEMKSTEAIIPEMTKAYEPHMKTYGWWGRKVCDQLRVRAWPWTPQSREPSVPDYLFRNSWKWCFEEGSQILLDIGPEPPSQRRNAANYGRSWFFNNRSRTWTSIFLDVSSSRRVGAPFACSLLAEGIPPKPLMLQMDPELCGPIWSGPFARWIFWELEVIHVPRQNWFPPTE